MKRRLIVKERGGRRESMIKREKVEDAESEDNMRSVTGENSRRGEFFPFISTPA